MPITMLPMHTGELEKVQECADYYDKAIKADPTAMLPYWNAGNKYLGSETI
jgi:hypothetical protein